MVGNLVEPDQNSIVTIFDVAQERYLWTTVIEDSKNTNNSRHLLKFTADGTRVLAMYRARGASKLTFTFLLVSTGAQSTTHSFQKQIAGSNLYKDGIVMNQTGSKIYYIIIRTSPNYYLTNFGVISFDASNSINPWSNQENVSWKAPSLNISNHKYSVVLSTDESRAITFSQSDGVTVLDCRYDVWDLTSSPITIPSAYNKGSSTVKNRNCRFPTFYTVSSGQTEHVIMLITEYYLESKAGFLQVALKSNYQQVATQDEEYVISGYSFKFTSAYYETKDKVYALAYDTTDSKNWLIYFDWNDPSKAPELWPLNGLSEDPNAVPYAGNAHIDSIIYAKQSDKNDFPVKGWIAGSTKSVWAYDDCLSPDFNIITPSYKKIVSSPGTKLLGYFSKLDLDKKSCNHEHVNEINKVGSAANLLGTSGQGIDSQNKNAQEYTKSGYDEDLLQVSHSCKTLSAASPSGITAPAWESSIDLTECQKTSADETYYDFVAAIFDGDDIFRYEIGSGNKNVDFSASDWYVNGNTCTIDFVYQLKIGPSSAITASTPTSASKLITVATTDLSLHNQDQKVTVLAKTNSYQCVQKDFTIMPYDCAQTVISSAFWIGSNNPLRQIEYTIIDSGTVNEIFKWTSSTACNFVTKIERETAVGSGVWNVYTGTEVSYAFNSNPNPGNHVYQATIQTNDVSIDTGGLLLPVWSFKITIGTPTLSAATRDFKIEITFKNRCRQAQVDLDKTFTMMESIIGAVSPTKMTVSQYSFTAPPGFTSADCGTQSISIFEDGLRSPLLYSSFITSSGMELSLQSSTDSHAGDYYLKVDVMWSDFPVKYRNQHELFVRLKPACKNDILSNSKFIAQNSASVAVYDHVIEDSSDSFTYSPIVNQFSYCTTLHYTLQEESSPGSGTWSDYSGPLFTHAQASQKLMIKTTAGDVGLDQTTKHFRLGVSTVTPLSSAMTPTILDITVKFVHRCHKTTFSESLPAQPALTQQPYAPSPYPTTDLIRLYANEFSYALGTGCGTQTVSLQAAIAPGILSDFITIARFTASSWEMQIGPTNINQVGQTYTLQLKVTLDNYPSVTYTSANTFKVEIQPSCLVTTLTGLVWSPSNSNVLAQQTIALDNLPISISFQATASSSSCDLSYELQYQSGSAYTLPHITLQSNTVVMQSNLPSLHATVDLMQLVVKVSANPGSSLSIKFSIKWQDDCIGTTFTKLQWTSGLAQEQLQVKLKNEAQTVGFALESAKPTCNNISMEVHTGGNNYAAYSDVHITLDTSLAPLYTIKAQSALLSLDQVKQELRIRASIQSEPSATRYLTFEVIWLHVCWLYQPQIATLPYPATPSILVFGPSLSLSSPTIITTYDGFNCGIYSYQVQWPSGTRIKQISTFLNGNFKFVSTDKLDAGEYPITVKILFDNYPTTLVSTNFKLIVLSCLPDKIISPTQGSSTLTRITHIIGSENGSLLPISSFTQQPDCGAPLNYYFTDKNGDVVDEDMQINALPKVDGSIIVSVATQDVNLAGLYKVDLVAKIEDGDVYSDPPYKFEVELTTSPAYAVSNNEDSLFPDQIGPIIDLPFTLPEIFDAKGIGMNYDVELGQTNVFVSYNSPTKTLFYTEGAKPILGTYSIRVTLTDTSSNLSRTYDLVLVIDALNKILKQFKSLQNTGQPTGTDIANPLDEIDTEFVEFLPDADSYLIPRIDEINTFGEVTIIWNKSMRRHNNNTYFEEEMKRMIWTQEVKTGQLIYVPALQIDFINSDVREIPIQFQWNFTGWETEQIMKMKLIYDNAKAVSMEIPADYLQITFWDQNLFVSDGYLPQKAARNLEDSAKYVQKQFILEERIPPQLPDDNLSASLNAMSNVIFAWIMALAGGSAILSLFAIQAMQALWSILHVLQLMVHLPLLVEQFPGYALVLYQVLIAIAKVDFVETGGFVPEWFGLNPDEESYNFQFALLQYESQNFLMNSGLILIWIFILGFLIVLTTILTLIAPKHSTVGRWNERLKLNLYFNVFIRSILELSLEFSIMAQLDIKVMNFSTNGYIGSYIASWVAFLTMIIFLILIAFCMIPNYSLLKVDKIRNRYSSAYDVLNIKSKKYALVYTIWFVARRIIFGTIVVFSQQHLWFSLQVLFMTSVGQMMTLGFVRPYEELSRNMTELASEARLMLVQYHLICFSDLVKPAETRSDMGLSCFMVTMIAVSLIVLRAFLEFLRILQNEIRRCIAKKRHERLMMQRRAQFKLRNLTLEELRRKCIQVQVKAKQTSYLQRLSVLPNAMNKRIDPKSAKYPDPAPIALRSQPDLIPLVTKPLQQKQQVKQVFDLAEIDISHEIHSQLGKTALQRPVNLSHVDDQVSYEASNKVQRGYNHNVALLFPPITPQTASTTPLAKKSNKDIYKTVDKDVCQAIDEIFGIADPAEKAEKKLLGEQEMKLETLKKEVEEMTPSSSSSNEIEIFDDKSGISSINELEDISDSSNSSTNNQSRSKQTTNHAKKSIASRDRRAPLDAAAKVNQAKSELIIPGRERFAHLDVIARVDSKHPEINKPGRERFAHLDRIAKGHATQTIKWKPSQLSLMTKKQ